MLRRTHLDENVTAFRSLQGRTNIDFAFESFEWIRSNPPCIALAFDVEGFFDNLDHQLLKRAYARTIGCSKLPDDHYKVFRAITKHSWVDQSGLKEKFGLSKSRPWRGNRSKRICTPAEFRKVVVDGGLINVNRTGKGIPQGSPISAVLSNLYMLEVDLSMENQVKNVGGFYRRYCDDILIVVPEIHVQNVVDTLETSIQGVKLKLQDEKTERCEFRFNSLNELVASKPLQYLGFTFDGSRIHFRSSSVQRYLTRMSESVQIRARDRQKANAKTASGSGPRRPLHTRKLRRRFSPVGRRNFVRYAYRAADRTGSSDLRKQIKRLVRQFERQLQNASNASG